MAHIHGENLLVSIGGEVIAASKSCSVDVNQEFITACSPADGRTKVKIPTTYDWSVSVDMLMVTTEQAATFLDYLKNGTELDLRWIAGGIKQGGKAFVKSWSQSGSVRQLATFSMQFESSGPLEDKRSEGWDVHAGNAYTYSDFQDGELFIGGSVTNGVWTPDTESE